MDCLKRCRHDPPAAPTGSGPSTSLPPGAVAIDQSAPLGSLQGAADGPGLHRRRRLPTRRESEADAVDADKPWIGWRSDADRSRLRRLPYLIASRGLMAGTRAAPAHVEHAVRTPV